MKIFVFLALLGLHSAGAVTHSLKYFYTGSSGINNFPEFVIVGMLNDVEMLHCDSITKKAEAKQNWMNKVTEGDPQYWETQTQICVGAQSYFKNNIEVVRQRFNQSRGVHVFQQMYGCEWDDETQEVNGFRQYGYDGEDFVAFDMKTETWIAPTPQAVITKHKWDNAKGWIVQTKSYLAQICVEWLKKYVNYGRSSLMRTVPPSVSLLQKTPSSLVSCLATGFYPDRAMMFWRKDGEELHEDVELGEILPNHDGSFQMSVDLDISSIPPEDWRRYECVFQLSGVKNDIITKLDKTSVDTNWGKTGGGRSGETNMTTGIIIGVVVLAVVLVAVIGVVAYKKMNPDCASSKCTSPEEKKAEVTQPLKPENTSNGHD